MFTKPINLASSLLLFLPLVSASLIEPKWIVKTVSVTVWAGSNKKTASTSKTTSSKPGQYYTYTSLFTRTKGQTLTSSGKTTILTVPTAWSTVVTKTWTDYQDWPAIEIYTSVSTKTLAQTVTRNGKESMIKSTSTSICTLTATHTGPPEGSSFTSSKQADHQPHYCNEPSGSKGTTKSSVTSSKLQ